MMYSLNEVGIIPAMSSRISSRSEVNPYIDGKLPLFVSPMTCILNDDNFKTFNNSKVTPIKPRSIKLTSIKEDVWTSVSLAQFKELFNACTAPEDKHYKILIDVANGHMQELYDCVEDAKQEYGSNLTVMVGNIANPETYLKCCQARVDYVRVGIGGGNACTTGVQTGIHASMVWLLQGIRSLKETMSEIESYSDEDKQTYHKLVKLWDCGGFRTKVIADGGIDTIDKAIKCLALGADYVMMGKLFAKCEEACGETRIPPIYSCDPGFRERKYYGMASEQGQKDISGGVKKNPEGIETWVPIKYTLNEFVNKFEAALRSCMSYCNCKTLDEFIGKVQIEYMTESEFKSYYK